VFYRCETRGIFFLSTKKFGRLRGGLT